MTSNCNVLLNVLEQKTIVIDLNEDDTEAALIFDCSALCQIRNANGNLIGVARQYPVVHYGVLKTLYSHCATHEHFIHNSDLFKQNDTNIVMSLTSLTKDNFEDLLEVLHRLIVNSHLSCHDRKKLVLNWLAEIIDALMQEDNGLLILPLLLKLSHAIIDIETLRSFAWLIDNNTKKVETSSSEQTNRPSTLSSTINDPVTSSSSSEVNVSTDKCDWWCDLSTGKVMAIHGIYVWLKNIHQLDWSWIQACEHETAGNLEQAAYEYKLLLNEHFKSLSMINEKQKEDKISGGLNGLNELHGMMHDLRFVRTIELETETGKLMHALSLNKANNINTTLAIEFLSRSILRHLINESQPNRQYNNQLSLINIEKCSRNLLHITKWSRTAT
ncbi:unnamed protein product [Rotaria magnacalcarata]|uniref:Uncharacterized protein n=1 Tax=Rotaria magnacalcarata TaxID=392030 RepID=A0A816T990_9BILA|nr:unnamed protein product [Rotaria magnacalcarata]